jgi:hypothetical protein
MINKFKQDLRQTSQRTMIKLCTDQSDGVNWNRLIYVKEVINNEQRQPVRTSKLITYFS